MKQEHIELVAKIKTNISEALKNVETPIAAFDADGTLWPTDMGETFFDYQIDNKLIKNLPESPWGHYKEMQENDHESAYLWLAQINKGIELQQVRSWAKEAVDGNKNFELFLFQKEIIDFLHSNDVKVYVVTASIKWAVEPGATLFNIPMENVIGIETSVENDIITDKQQGSITYKEGKVKKLLENTNGVYPFFASGNTLGDLPLLESATDIKFSIASAPEDDRNYSSEQELKTISKNKNWFHLDIT